VTGAEAEAAARLLERVLTDQAYRESFRRNPVAAAREAGLASVAEEMAMGTGKAMDTLDGRESRSSLAGVFMAAALEGAGIYDFSKDLTPHLQGIPEQVEQVLSRAHSHGGLAPPAGFADVGGPGSVAPLTEVAAASPPAPPNSAGEFSAIPPEQAAAAQVLPAVPDPSLSPASGAQDGADAAAAGAEPDGLEDPGGDTDAQADAESDGGEDDDASDDASDEEEDDENEGGESSDGDDGGESGSDGGNESANPAPVDDRSDSDDGGANPAPVDVGDVGGGYPGDSATPEQIAAWMGGEAQKRGLPAELPVMAALVESGMHNLDHGDADSVGYFQMRRSVWNQGAYAGYPDRAQLQLKWFLEQASAVKRQRIAAGKSVDDPEGYGEWIADVERPRADYRGRYQLRLADARDLLRQAPEGHDDDGGDGAGVQPEPVVDGSGAAAGPRALAALAEARKHLGTPYKWGGSTPQTGFDCSGLVQWAYAKAGIAIPRTSEQQILASNGKPVDRAHLRPGDLVFFRDAGGDVHHVGISLGGDKFLNAPHTGAKVRVDDLNQSYYAREFAGGRRFDVAPSGDASVGGDKPGPGSGVDPDAVRQAEAALARDAAEAQRPGTLVFEAVKAQELRKTHHALALGEIDPSATT
jgi:hypothetical protein